MANPAVLVVDDEEIACANLTHVLQREGLAVDSATSGEAALRLLAGRRYQLVLTDLRMPGIDGVALLQAIKGQTPETEVIVITAHASAASAVEAMRAGAFYYVEKPFRLDDVRKVVREALEKGALRAENAQLKAALALALGQGRIVTSAPSMEELLAIATRVAPTHCTVLIEGETGTGKEVMARFIHENSARSAGPFVAINCGALSEELLSNELFGHERGAFTGAGATKNGLLETAQGGTLFLDEVTEMSPAIQVKFLRVLQEREFLRLGGTTPIRVDIRVIAATNRDPQACVAAGQLRQDLYFRLNVVTLAIPPLRERRGDVPLLATHFLSRAAHQMGKKVDEIHPEAFEILLAHDFPGNVRELENLIERGVALATGPQITPDLLPRNLRRSVSMSALHEAEVQIVPLAELERQHIQRALDHTGGNRTEAARLLGIDRVSLWRKLRS